MRTLKRMSASTKTRHFPLDPMMQRLMAVCLLAIAVILWSWVFNRPDPRPVLLRYSIMISDEASAREIDAIHDVIVASGGLVDKKNNDLRVFEIIYVEMSVSTSGDVRAMPHVTSVTERRSFTFPAEVPTLMEDRRIRYRRDNPW